MPQDPNSYQDALTQQILQRQMANQATVAKTAPPAPTEGYGAMIQHLLDSAYNTVHGGLQGLWGAQPAPPQPAPPVQGTGQMSFEELMNKAKAIPTPGK